MSALTPERLWAHVTKNEAGCWLWRGAINGKGYGQSRWMGKQVVLHRLSWIFANGAIPQGICVCHRCDVRACINPDHLFLGTQAENIQDAARKGRIGQPNPRRKICAADVPGIRERLASGESQASVAASFGANQSVVSRAIRGIQTVSRFKRSSHVCR